MVPDTLGRIAPQNNTKDFAEEWKNCLTTNRTLAAVVCGDDGFAVRAACFHFWLPLV